MAKYISTHARYRLGATALAVAGGLSCLGALMTGHGMTLLVVGMLSFSTSMLIMSLSPRQEYTRAAAEESEPRAREERTVEVSIHRVGADGRKAGPPEPDRTRDDREVDGQDEFDGVIETVASMGRKRPTERKRLTWSI